MSISHLLEDFGTSSDTMFPIAQAHDTELLESFENGYKAGWEDAVRAKSEEQAFVSTELSRNLQDLTFTYHEAKVAILAEIAPVVEQAVMSVVPKIAQEAFPSQIATHIKDLAALDDTAPIDILVAASDFDAVSHIVPDLPNIELNILVDESLLPGQAQMRLGSRERQIDITEIVKGVAEAFSGFVQQAKMEAMHG